MGAAGGTGVVLVVVAALAVVVVSAGGLVVVVVVVLAVWAAAALATSVSFLTWHIQPGWDAVPLLDRYRGSWQCLVNDFSQGKTVRNCRSQYKQKKNTVALKYFSFGVVVYFSVSQRASSDVRGLQTNVW